MTGYPVIMNGDHAEFEREHANTPPHERPDWPLPSFAATDWAKAFCERFKVIKRSEGWKEALLSEESDEDLMVAWFANALMRGFDERAARGSSQLIALNNLIFAVENDKKVHSCGGLLERALKEAKGAIGAL